MRSNRWRRVIGCILLALLCLIAANGLLYPRCSRAEVYFKWGARTGFPAIYVFPPGEKVSRGKRLLGYTTASESRPFTGGHLSDHKASFGRVTF